VPIQLASDFRVRSGTFVAPNETLQFLEKPGFIRRVEFLTQSAQHLLDQGDRPARFILGVRIDFLRLWAKTS
jgi:hypothetical protein